jgi:hypothetical protein
MLRTRPIIRAPAVVFAALFLHAPIGCKKKEPEGPVRGSGVGSKVARSTPAFSKLEVRGSVRAEVEVGKPHSLELLGDDNLLPLVRLRVNAGTLVIDSERVLKGTQPLVARITAPSLDGITLTAASDGFVKGVKADHFVARLVGATRLHADGTSRMLEVVVKGAAQAKLKGLAVRAAHVTTSEAARVELGRIETLEVSQKGASVVTYEGSPEITRSVTPPARLIRTGT